MLFVDGTFFNVLKNFTKRIFKIAKNSLALENFHLQYFYQQKTQVVYIKTGKVQGKFAFIHNWYVADRFRNR